MSKFKRLSIHDKATIMKMRAIGYNNQEIANKIGCSEPTISYHLSQIREKAKLGYEEELFWGLVSTLTDISIIELTTKLNLNELSVT